MLFLCLFKRERGKSVISVFLVLKMNFFMMRTVPTLRCNKCVSLYRFGDVIFLLLVTKVFIWTPSVLYLSRFTANLPGSPIRGVLSVNRFLFEVRQPQSLFKFTAFLHDYIFHNQTRKLRKPIQICRLP